MPPERCATEHIVRTGSAPVPRLLTELEVPTERRAIKHEVPVSRATLFCLLTDGEVPSECSAVEHLAPVERALGRGTPPGADLFTQGAVPSPRCGAEYRG